LGPPVLDVGEEIDSLQIRCGEDVAQQNDNGIGPISLVPVLLGADDDAHLGLPLPGIYVEGANAADEFALHGEDGEDVPIKLGYLPLLLEFPLELTEGQSFR
jgi:hypothetical protein